MSISANDIKILRYIQGNRDVSLSELSNRFHKNSITLRRTIESLNLHSVDPIITISNSICSTKMSYTQLASFIRSISFDDYRSTQKERINVFIVCVFFESYVNASKLYDNWGLSLTTKKKDMSYLRDYIKKYKLEIKQIHKKGLTIVGDELILRLLVTNILYPLFEIGTNGSLSERVTNSPIEHQCYFYLKSIEDYTKNASLIINQFLKTHQIGITSLSERFILLFISFMIAKPFPYDINPTKLIPLSPTNFQITMDSKANEIYNIVFILLDYSKHLEFPFNQVLFDATCEFVDSIINSLTSDFYTRDELIDEYYAYFYRMIIMKSLHVELPDRLVDHLDDKLSILFQIIQKYTPIIEGTFSTHFNNEQLTTLTFILQKMMMRNRIVTDTDKTRQKVIIISNSTYERIDYFIAQIQEYFDIEIVTMLSLKQRSLINNYKYDYIFCLSERIYNILKEEGYPALQFNYFVSNKNREKLELYGFQRIKTRFLTEHLVDEIYGLSKEEMITHLKHKYKDYFI